jgi:hypothetical protein
MAITTMCDGPVVRAAEEAASAAFAGESRAVTGVEVPSEEHATATIKGMASAHRPQRRIRIPIDRG